MLRIVAIFALLTVVSGAFAFGWIGDEDGSEIAMVLFWACAVLLAALTLRAVLKPRSARG